MEWIILLRAIGRWKVKVATAWREKLKVESRKLKWGRGFE